MCNCYAHIIVILALGACWAIIGGITGSRYVTRRHATCVQYVDCPQYANYPCDSGSSFFGSNTCVKMIDEQGVSSIVSVGSDSRVSINLGAGIDCWTDNISVTFNDPYLVMFWCLSVLGVITAGYVVVSLCVYRWWVST